MIDKIRLDLMDSYEIKKLVEKMKNCANCKQFKIRESLDKKNCNYCLLCGNLNDDLSSCGNWELAE